VEEHDTPEESNITPIEEEPNPTPDESYVEPPLETSTKSRLSLPADETSVETSNSSRLSLPADETSVQTSAEPVVMKKKRSPPKAKAKAAAAPGIEEEITPIQPEVEIPVEEIKIAEKKPRAKAKPRAKPTPKPTHDADEVEVPPQGPAPPARAPPMKYESPDEFWNNTIKNMKEKKKKQYEQLAAQAF
jgi:hypothetical protein